MTKDSSEYMQGKNIIVTGASRGIGYYTALGLAKIGARVSIISHNEKHCQHAVEKINEETGEKSADYYVADLSVQDEIRKVSKQVRHDCDHIDVLINNVGGWFSSYQESADEIEMTFALNHLSYYLLTGLLLDHLMDSAPARIVNVASNAHHGIDRIHFEDIGFNQGSFRPFKAYAQSKLANIMFTYKLAERLKGTGITANALHPGSVSSRLYRNFGILEPVIRFWVRLTGKSSKEGAQTSIYLASSSEVGGVNGKYFDEEQNKVQSSEISYDQEQWEQLWEISEEMTRFSYPSL